MTTLISVFSKTKHGILLKFYKKVVANPQDCKYKSHRLPTWELPDYVSLSSCETY